MSSTTRMGVSIVAAVALWLVGGIFLSHALGMVCVFVGICIAGYAGGQVMDTPCPTSDLKQ